MSNGRRYTGIGDDTRTEQNRTGQDSRDTGQGVHDRRSRVMPVVLGSPRVAPVQVIQVSEGMFRDPITYQGVSDPDTSKGMNTEDWVLECYA
ncbi:hypothetical protein M0804_003739 [Polistes exclamans]|nr:hypothetical protein M0804_003739 [Polistes exclamans]